MTKPAPRPDRHVLADFAQGAKVELYVDGEWRPGVVSFHGNARLQREDGGDGPLVRLDPQTPARAR